MNLKIKPHHILLLLLTIVALIDTLFFFSGERVYLYDAIYNSSVISDKLTIIEQELGNLLINHPFLFVEYLAFTFIIILTTLTGLILWLIILIKKTLKHPPALVTKLESSWGFIEIFESICFYIILRDIFSRISASVVNLYPVHYWPFLYLLMSLLFEIGIVSIVLLYIFKISKTPVKMLFHGFNSFLKQVLYGIKNYILLFPILVIFIMLIVIASSFFEFSSKPHFLFPMILTQNNKGILIFIFLFAGILGPIFEEFLFRFFFYRALRNKFIPLISIIISATVFSMLHRNAVGFFPIFLLGCMLAWVYEKSQSLIPPITIHIIHNGFLLWGIWILKKVYMLV